VVAWSLYAVHRREDLYGNDAAQFRPERWLDEPAVGRKGLRPGWEYLPFNGGLRICLGQQYALPQASYSTVRLSQTFSGIESRDQCANWIENLHFTCRNRKGAEVGLKPRHMTRVDHQDSTLYPKAQDDQLEARKIETDHSSLLVRMG
jgi:cytochrome P450